jgi:glycerol-3-phosphate dehydrogenase
LDRVLGRAGDGGWEHCCEDGGLEQGRFSMQRKDQIERIKAETFDLLVIGGGATGCGVALDAASRGLRVALVERQDFSEGTSSRSTKLIHGGVRYLEQAIKGLDVGQFNLVRDALHERAVLLRLAPHLARAIALITPLYRIWEAPYYWTGLKMYDALSGKASVGASSFLSKEAALERMPTLRQKGLIGAVLYYDGQFDDARMNVSIALTAIAHGAAVANYVEVTDFIKEGGRVIGARLRDAREGQTFEVKARGLVNATGPYTDNLRRMDDPAVAPMVSVSSGVHIILDGSFIPRGTGMLIPKTEDGRVAFALPWLGQVLAGTTDNPANVGDHPLATEEEIEYILRHLRRYFEGDITRAGVKAAWCGLRPLVSDPKAGGTARLSRDHVIVGSPSGLITITGGKWTTYRKMAEDCVDQTIRLNGLRSPRECQTNDLPLLGGAGYAPGNAAWLAKSFGLEREVADYLNQAYGDRSEGVARLSSQGYAARLTPGYPCLEAEVLWAAREELAQSPLDVLARRLRLAFLDLSAAEAALPRVCQLLSKEFAWDAKRRVREEQLARERLEQAL